MDIASDIALNDQFQTPLGAVPSSFVTQMAMATGMVKRGSIADGGTDRLMGRLMLARMKNLEESFQEVVREFREARTQANSSVEVEAAEERRVNAVGAGAGAGASRDKGKKVAKRKSRPSSRTRKAPVADTGKENDRPESATEMKEEEKVVDIGSALPAAPAMEAFLAKGNSL